AFAQATANVTVIDVTPPTISCPANVVAGNDAGFCSATVSPGSATAVDNCSGNLATTGTRSDGQPLNAPYPVGVTTITWSATDGSGNSSTCKQTITVNDTQAPSLTVPSAITTEFTSNAGAV